MTENPHDPQPIMRRLVWPIALAAVAVAGCSSSAGSTAVRATSDRPATVTVTSAPIAAPAPIPAVTQAPETTVTVTVAPPPAPTTVVVQATASGPSRFQSPSGNIHCTMFTFTTDGQIGARCEVVDHAWAAPPREPACQLNWGDRFELTQGNAALFSCYGQPLPAPEQTLGYGQARSLGAITCVSESTGMTCTDSSTGHYFRVSREGYELG